MVDRHVGILSAKRVRDMTGIGRKPAFARQRIADQCNMPKWGTASPIGAAAFIRIWKNVEIKHHASTSKAREGMRDRMSAPYNLTH